MFIAFGQYQSLAGIIVKETTASVVSSAGEYTDVGAKCNTLTIHTQYLLYFFGCKLVKDRRELPIVQKKQSKQCL